MYLADTPAIRFIYEPHDSKHLDALHVVAILSNTVKRKKQSRLMPI